MNTRERFEKVRQEQRNRFSLRTRLTTLVTLEMLVCVLISYGVDQLLNKVFPWEVPLELELVGVCLLVGILVTSKLSKFFFDPIKKLRGAMDKVAEGDFSVRLEEKSSSKEILEIYTGFNLMAHELSSTEILQTDFVSNVSHEFKTPMHGYYYGGGMIPTPKQDRTSGKLSLMLFHGAGRLRTLCVFPSIFKGEHIKHTKMVAVHTGKEITVEFDRPTPLQIDGETILSVTKYTAYAAKVKEKVL